MKYEANIKLDFDNLDDLSNKLATVLVAMNEQRDEFDPLSQRLLTEHGDTISGEGWDIELVNSN